MDDSQIVAMYFARNPQAIEYTQEKYGRYCLSIARRALGNSEDAAECVNQAYLAAWNSIPPQRPACLSAYVGKLTRRISLSLLRSRSAKKRGGGQAVLALEELSECVCGGPTPEESLMEAHLADALARFLSSLGREERRMFVLRYWHLYSVREIASRMGCGESRVKTGLFRARGKLQVFLRKEGYII